MSPAAAFHAQLASIMEVLANTAVAEICELVDSGYSVLQLEISRSRKENEVLRRKLRLMELRAARASALRAAAAAAGLPHASNRARAQLTTPHHHHHHHHHHHPGNEPRTDRTSGDDVVLPRLHLEAPPCVDPTPLPSDPGQEATQSAAAESDLTTAVIKVEDDGDESWSQAADDGFGRVVEGQTETEAPPPPTKHESVTDGGDSSRSWTSGEVSPTSMNTGQQSEPGGYDGLMYDPQLQPGSHTTHNPLGEDPGCLFVLSVSGDPGGGGGFSFNDGDGNQQPAVYTDDQQRALLATEDGQNAFIRPAGGSRDDDGGGKSFVCNCCGKTLSCLKNLRTHMRVHTGEKPFVCSLCGKRFSDSSNLKRHQSVHTGEKRYGCVHCGKRFAQSNSLKVHMAVHSDCKQFRCSFCSKTFISGGHLRRHVTVHAGEKPFTHSDDGNND